VLAAAVVLVVGTGCSSSTSGTASPETSAADANSAVNWDPCTQISDDVVRQVGADPTTRETGVGGVAVEGWKACSWYFQPEKARSLTVWSSKFTADDLKKKSDNIDFAAISVAGRDGWRYHRASDTRHEDCDLVFPAKSGSFQLSFYNLTPSITADPCDGAMSAADTIVPLFPR
jgi:hypothetical protein